MKRVLIYGEKSEIEKFHRIHDAYMGNSTIINAFILKGVDKSMYAELIACENDNVIRATESDIIVALFDENNQVTFFNDDIRIKEEEYNNEQALFAIGLEKQFEFSTAEAILSVDIDDFSDTSDLMEVLNDGYVYSDFFDASVSLLSAVALSEKIFGERIYVDEVLHVKTFDNIDKFLESKKSLIDESPEEVWLYHIMIKMLKEYNVDQNKIGGIKEWY